MKYLIQLVLAFGAMHFAADAAAQTPPPCLVPTGDCPLTCVASAGTEANQGTGTPAQVAALLADVDVSVTYDAGNGVSGNGKICNGTANEADGGCATCSQCWVFVSAAYTNHAGNSQYQSRIMTDAFQGSGVPWSGDFSYGRSGYLKVNCDDFGYNRIEVTADGGATILYTEGVTLICGCSV